ncbi:MAG: PDZ domain-containing protein, partial [Pirellulaceae bacterium]|nr:PDZ domain-containing protein [Pirellulaceae bacterium]
LVMEVRGNSPAASSGLKSGDVILQFNGVTVEDDAHLVNIVKLTEVGSRVSLVVLRDRSPQSVHLHLAEWTGE